MLSVELRQDFSGSVPGRWVVELEGWQKEPPQVGAYLAPAPVWSKPLAEAQASLERTEASLRDSLDRASEGRR